MHGINVVLLVASKAVVLNLDLYAALESPGNSYF